MIAFTRKARLISLIISSLIVYSCLRAGVNDSDLMLIEDSAESTIEENDFVSLNYTEKNEDGKLIAQWDNTDPAMILVDKPTFKKDFSSMLRQLSEGDSARFKVRIDSIIQKQGRKFSRALKGTYLQYDVRINKVIKRGNQTDREYDLAIEKYKQQSLEKQKQQENEEIKRYIAQSSLHFSETPSGLFYTVARPGTGPAPRAGDSVVVMYTGSTLNGKVFETTDPQTAKNNHLVNDTTKITPFRGLIRAEPLSGFMEALGMFPEKTDVILIIPSKLAYGAQRYKMLKPFTPIVCKLQVIRIIRPIKKQEAARN